MKKQDFYIKYSEGYKYQLEQIKTIQTDIKGYNVKFDWYELKESGLLTIYKGYAWDGMTGFIDTKNNRVYSLVHDVFCQMMRNKQIPHIYKGVNEYCLKVGLACGMGNSQVKLVTCAVNLARSGDPARGADRPILIAP